MLLETGTIATYFSELGLEPESAEVYLALHTYGSQSISEISRNSAVERTRIYRLIDKLKDAHLVTTEKARGKTLLKAAPIANLHILLNKKEQDVKSLQDKLWVIERLLANNVLASPVTKVQFYQGAEGVRQMFWNETKGKGENVGFFYENMQSKTGKEFFERWVRQCNERDIEFRGLIGERFVESQQEWYKAHANERIQNWTARFLPPKVLEITHSMAIYDNVVSYYIWKDADVFGVEIYNQQIADAQRTFFEMLWAQGVPVDDIVGPRKKVSDELPHERQ